jgi:hypothetical protein
MQIHFCDLCNESVPQTDLDAGRAARIKGRVVCARCDAAMNHAMDAHRRAVGAMPSSAAEWDARAGEGASSAPLASAIGRADALPSTSAGSVVGVVLASIALLFAVATWAHLLGRVEEGEEARGVEDRTLGERIELAMREARTQSEEARAWVGSAREAAGALQGSLRALEERLASSDRAQAESAARSGTALAEARERLAALEELVAVIARRGGELEAAHARELEMSSAVGALSEHLATLELESARAAEANVPSAPEAPIWWPLVAKLASSRFDDRWEAVQALGETRDPAVVPHLVPLLKDVEIFVRMATARVLGLLSTLEGVPALIDALEDAESSVREAAWLSLTALAGRDIAFDAFAKEAERKKSVRAWREWWEKEGARALEAERAAPGAGAGLVDG